MEKAYNDRLRELREDYDLTQKQVAEVIGIRYNVYQRYEYGINLIPIDKLIRLADYYHTSTDYILGRVDDPRPIDELLAKGK